MRQWDQDTDSPDVDDATWQAAITRFDKAVDAVCARSAELAKVAAGVVWVASTTTGEEHGSASVTHENEPAVLIHFTCLMLDDAALQYVIAHELMHHMLGHVGSVDPDGDFADDAERPEPEEGDEPAYTTDRVHMRAVEPLVTDHLTRLGFAMPAALEGRVRSGQWAIGFDMSGLTAPEVFEMLCGRMSWHALKDLAEHRSGQVARGELDHDAPVPDLAIGFWQQHLGPWQDAWVHDHTQLHQATLRGLSAQATP